jgi:chromosomal replication initiation ATPase DnaA
MRRIILKANHAPGDGQGLSDRLSSREAVGLLGQMMYLLLQQRPRLLQIVAIV